jgi:LuxR family transcriptional regulator, quorum-sensing system regulator LasR
MQFNLLSQAALDQLSCVTTENDVMLRLSDIAASLNFDFFLYAEVFRSGTRNPKLKIISNYPSDWRLKYDAENYIAIDPIMHHCEHRLVPLIWSDISYQSYRQREFMEEARGFGLASGISFPNHSKDGDVGVLSFASRSAGGRTGDARFEPVAIAQGALTAAFAHDAIERLANRQEEARHSPLTGRELECLKWIAIGKTTWEISSILGISEHGVLYHVRNIMRKFDAQTRHMAVLKAMASGLI